jgi:hypothetical protein
MKNDKLIRLLLVVACIGLSACSSPKIYSGKQTNNLLFPYGNYRHAVKIKINPNEKTNSKEFAFNGVVQFREDWVKIVVLSPFGTTLAKVQEDLKTGKIEFVSYLENFKKYESKFTDYYAILRSLFLVKKDPKAPVEKIETVGLTENATFFFKDYDSHNIPNHITIQGPKVAIEIQVSGYDV